MAEHPYKSLSGDTEIYKAKQLILNRIKHLQSDLKVSPPKKELEDSYENTIHKFSSHRGGGLWYPYLGSGLGSGPLVELADGSIKYDLISGIGPHFFGHSNLDLIDSAIDGALEDIAMQGHLQQNPITYEVTNQLISLSGMDHCFLSSVGAMANENAFKIIFQKKFPARRILAFERCFMGRTIATASVGDKSAIKQGLPDDMQVDYIPFYDYKDPEGSTHRALSALDKFIQRYPGQHAFITAELVQGEGGFYPGSEKFFRSIFTKAKEANIAVLCDEIQTFARTPELFAYHYFNLKDLVDVVTLGKVSYICATLFKEEYKPKPGLLSQTFIGASTALHVTHKILKTLSSNKFYGNNGIVEQVHQKFVKVFEYLERKHPGSISGPFGIGSMIAFTLFDGKIDTTKQFLNFLYKKGIICFIAGNNPARVRILPPTGVLTDKHIDDIGMILDQALAEFQPNK